MARWKDARALAAALFVAAAVALAPAPRAHADQASDKKAAHEAYERGARAFGQGSYAVAATEFARADELQPAPAALEAALKAAILAEDPVLAMTLVDRAAARPANEAVSAQVARARDRFAHKVGRLKILCASPCSAKVGNETVPVGATRVYLAGNYVIEIHAGGAPELFAVQLPGGSSMEWKPPSKASPPAVADSPTSGAPTALPTFPALLPTPAPSTPPAPLAPQRSTLSPAWFGIGAGVTAISAGLAIGFGVDTLNQHAAFVNAPTDEGSAAGQGAQLRTNVFIGVAAATAVATAIIGYFTFRTTSDSSSRARSASGAAAPAR